MQVKFATAVERTKNTMSNKNKEPECVYIECISCGHKNHYDTAHATSVEGPGRCQECSSFIRQPTQEEHEQFTEFMKSNSEVE